MLKPNASTTTVYPAPIEEEASLDYSLTINGTSVFVHRARVSAHPLNRPWNGVQRPLSQSEIAAFASWDMAAPVEVNVFCNRPVEHVRVRPSSYGIEPIVKGNNIRFTVKNPGQMTVEINGTHHALHLFANRPERSTPDPKDPSVRYFGPGVHCPGLIVMKSNETLYLAGGAVVYGAVHAEKAENIAILGRGILDGSKFDRLDGLSALVSLYECENSRIEGITLRDSGTFTFAHAACRRIRIRNIKIIGQWRANSDGINFINCQHCSVDECFIRAFDDCFCIKGYEKFGNFIYKLELPQGMPSDSAQYTYDGVIGSFDKMMRSFGDYTCGGLSICDIQVKRCVLWNDWGKALEIGIETIADEITDIVFEDCDIIHVSGVAMDITTHDRAKCKNILFQNIRVELDDDLGHPVLQQREGQCYEDVLGDDYSPYLIKLEVGVGYCTIDTIRGEIDGVCFRDITVTSRSIPPSVIHGHSAIHLVKRVEIQNLKINDRLMTDLKTAGFIMNEFQQEISIKEKRGIEVARRNKVKINRVLILGNSITKHPGLKESGWPGVKWGMAASAPEKDYVHQLLQHLTSYNEGIAPESMVENIAEFERHHEGANVLQIFKKEIDFSADIVIIAIGENVSPLLTEEAGAVFRTQFTSLIEALKPPRNASIFVRSSFWPDLVKDRIMKEACESAGGTFIDITAIGENPANRANAERPFKDDGVAIHPGDAGMKAIAEAISDAIWRIA